MDSFKLEALLMVIVLLLLLNYIIYESLNTMRLVTKSLLFRNGFFEYFSF